ncbi:mitogen-activated protein kinase [Gnomoniopsis smithogilvyi]|uniref:cyclin-dependent kinase n=1 Tax=Gnomoniopsis smithogilvyi TaxID=1191159 RepID=A0A9W8YJ78_9PEZI|nr:mitogen-activated protein kinase [Gnomoniopsis smithogilvyi]
MSDHKDWQEDLKPSQRYDNIQKIQNAIDSNPLLAAGKTAFSIENEAYTSSSSREQYDAACELCPEYKATPPSPPFTNSYTQGHQESLGERIGAYENCHYIASGVTAEVYRHNDRALKVITETRNIEPHNPLREANILSRLRKPCIPLLDTFYDHEQRFTLVFPYMPLTLSALLEQSSLDPVQIRSIFTDILRALSDIHAQGIIHRDIKPQAILLASAQGPAYLSDFGTAWHPELSVSSEPADAKVLDIGTGPYRAPEVLFGNKSYGTAIDMWAVGSMLAECARRPPRPLFESRPVHEDGNQLGLILSIFKTIGTPTKETWPEAQAFRTPPFELYKVFEARPWEEILDNVDDGWADLIRRLVQYRSDRMTAKQALQHPYMRLV